jgi:sugar phosphate isomerase/epimerase
MSFLSRRTFVTAAAAGAVFSRGLALAAPRFRIGVTDWNLRLASKLEAVHLAADLGFEGVEVSLGRKMGADASALPLADKELQKKYLQTARERKIALAGTCLDILHVNYLKSDKLGLKWVADGIAITRDLGAGRMLLPFFGKGALETQAERDYAGDALRELSREAQKAKVVLGLENTCSARQNAAIMERAQSPALQVYYDVGNSTNQGYDIMEELRWLGAARICQIHLKDGKGYLGEGQIRFPEVINVIKELGFSGFCNLETSAPSGDVAADMKRNLAFLRGITG